MGQAARPGQGHGGGAGMAVAAPGLAFPRGCILLAPVWLCSGHLPLSPSRGTSDCSLHPSSPSPDRTGAMISIFLRGSTSQQTPKLEFLSCRHTPDPSPGCSEAGVSPHPPYPVLPSPRALRGHAHAAGRPGPGLEGRGGDQGDLAAGPAQGLLSVRGLCSLPWSGDPGRGSEPLAALTQMCNHGQVANPLWACFLL
ncbi:glutathione S-transferase P isoform X2 [Felis catus]|uniref:glutathione S-transferase P isoform X2 n=1 Tax=Felis catus TaxID=9685 RepID=UPI001D19F051|nr:glutathione S-transferase P isoform X2 [Felis catus]